MKRYVTSTTLLLLLVYFQAVSQVSETLYQGLHFSNSIQLTEPVTNCAVESVEHKNELVTYIFGGIDSTLKWSGIHRRCYKIMHKPFSGKPLPDLPDTVGRIALSATRVGDYIYVVGGYSVAADGTEESSANVFEFDMAGDTFTSKQITLPVPIDDHVQLAYKDSLLYIIGGWSNTINVGNVQIFDPANNKWLVGTRLPDSRYKVFGASGVLSHRKIVFVGGARYGVNFPASKNKVEGIIDSSDPTKISWSVKNMCDSCVAYRAGCLVFKEMQSFWFGGSDTTYNYDGKAYMNGSQLTPSNRWLNYNSRDDSLTHYSNPPALVGEVHIMLNNVPLPMDIRDAGNTANYTVFAGGIQQGGKVYDRLTVVEKIYTSSLDNAYKSSSDFTLFPNPASTSFNLSTVNKVLKQIFVYNSSGQVVYSGWFDNLRIDCSLWPAGIYRVNIVSENGVEFKSVVKH